MFAIQAHDKCNPLQLGVQTLNYDRSLNQGEAAMRRREIAQHMMNGGDPFELNARLAHLKTATVHQSQERRPLFTPDEVLNAPAGDAFMFVDGLQYPAIVERRNYYDMRIWSGRYHPNPYAGSTDRVQIQTRFGKRWRRVVKEPVDPRFSHLPQYRNGMWSVIKR